MIRNPASAALGSAIFALGIAVLIGASRISSGFSYDAVGPGLFPNLIGAGLIVAGCLVVLDGFISKTAKAEDGQAISFLPVVVISAAILTDALFIRSLGWVPVTAVLFTAGAWAFGDRRIALNITIGAVLGLVILAAFNFGLDLKLPLGPLEPVVDFLVG